MENIEEYSLEKKSFFKALRDFISNLDMFCLWALLISFALGIGIYLFAYDLLFHFANVAEYCFDYCPMLIGFGIAAYAFLINMNKNNETFIERVRMKITIRGQKKTIASYFFASIIWFIFIMFVDFVCAIIIQINDSDIMFTIFCGFIIYTLCLFMDLLLKLFSFHTFIYPSEGQD